MTRMTYAQALVRLGELAQQRQKDAFEIGDIALDQVPMGPTTGPNGHAEEKLAEMAERADLTVSQLEQRRFTSSRVPLASREANVSWSVYREIANLVADVQERQRLFDLVAQPNPETATKRWTVSTLRVAMGRKPIQHTGSEPLLERLQTAPPEARADAYQALSRDAEVRRVIQQRYEERETAEDVARREALASDGIARKLDALQARNTMEGLMDRFVRDMGDVLPRVDLPNPEQDPWATAYFLKGRIEAIRTICDQVEALMRTGKVGGDVEDFFIRVLAESRKGGAA